MFPSPNEFLKHILDECNYLLEQYNNTTFNDMAGNKTISHAFCQSLEIIGEAAKKVPPDIKVQYPLVDWKRMTGMRDKIIHNYFGVDYEIIWSTIEKDIPELQRWVKIIIETESPPN